MRTMTFFLLSMAVALAGCQSLRTVADSRRGQQQQFASSHPPNRTNQSPNVARGQSQPPPVKLAAWQEGEQQRLPTLSPAAGLNGQQSVVGFVQPAEPNNGVAPPTETLPIPRGGLLPPGDLTLEQLESVAMGNSPALAQAAAAVEATRGNWLQVGLFPNPMTGYVGQQLNSHGQAEQQGAFVSQEFVMGRKLRLNREAAAWEIQRAERELDAMRLRVLTDTRIGFYDVLIAQRRRELAGDLVKISDQGVAAAQALFQGEEVSEADPLRARVDAAQARILLQTARNMHLEAWQRLAAVLGMPQWELKRIDGDLQPSRLELTWEDTMREILTASPEVAAAMADVEAARWTLRRAQVQAIPNLNVFTVFQDDRGTGSSNANLRVGLPLPIFDRNQGRIREAQAGVVATQRAVDRMTLDLQIRLAAAFQRYQTASNQVQRYTEKGGILENAQKTLDLIRAGYRAEEFGLVDLLTAQRTYFQANLTYLDSLRELWVSVMEIKGLLLKNSLPR